jgi:predicted dithiol-disulfide oxidoreductase (DUF899 family)
MTTHTVGTREEWLAARKELLEREKELTRRSDELARARRELPWVPVEEEYVFQTDEGPNTLGELFDGRSQLLVYHLMYGPNDGLACEGCSFTADTFERAVVHAEHRDVAFVAVSRAPLEKLQAYKERTGWTFRWVSSYGTDFNLDFSVFTEEERRTGEGFNFGSPGGAGVNVRDMELHGLSAFVLEDGVVYHTYSTYDRGTDGLNATWQLLDRAPKGRGQGSGWPLRYFDYEHTTTGATR